MSQMEPDPEDLEILALLNAARRPGTTRNGRRVREARPLSHADQAGSGLKFLPLGSHTLKGLPDEWMLYDVVALH